MWIQHFSILRYLCREIILNVTLTPQNQAAKSQLGCEVEDEEHWRMENLHRQKPMDQSMESWQTFCYLTVRWVRAFIYFDVTSRFTDKLKFYFQGNVLFFVSSIGLKCWMNKIFYIEERLKEAQRHYGQSFKQDILASCRAKMRGWWKERKRSLHLSAAQSC